jgi:Alginate lyase
MLRATSQMAYKMALAWHVTRDERYAAKVFQIADAWATTNKVWGLRWCGSTLNT